MQNLGDSRGQGWKGRPQHLRPGRRLTRPSATSPDTHLLRDVNGRHMAQSGGAVCEAGVRGAQG